MWFLFGGVSSSSWYLRQAVILYCGTHWAFHIMCSYRLYESFVDGTYADHKTLTVLISKLMHRISEVSALTALDEKSRGMRKPNQRLCFQYTDSTIPLLHKFKVASLLQSSEVVQPGLYWTWSETPNQNFMVT